MARPLQKKKNKSSLPRVRQKPKSKRINIKSNPIVAANWDQSLTLSQNYRRLGLSSKLNSSSGGTEKKATIGLQQSVEPVQKDPLAIPSGKSTKLEPGTVRVVRDPKTGAITGIVREDEARPNPLNDPLNALSDEDDRAMMDGSVGAVGNAIVPELMESAKYEKKKRLRKQSQREQDWIGSLVTKWGDDWKGMVRDRKLNPMQQSEGDLKRRVSQWQKTRNQDSQDAGDAPQ